MFRHLHRASLLALALAGALGATSVSATERSWSYSYNSLGLIETADGPRTDVADITRYAYERVEAGLAMPGVFEVSRALPLGQVVADLVLVATCSHEGEWEGQVQYLPLR